MDVSGAPPLITPDELSRMTGGESKPDVIRRKCREAELPAVKIGNKWYIVKEMLFRGVAR